MLTYVNDMPLWQDSISQKKTYMPCLKKVGSSARFPFYMPFCLFVWWLLLLRLKEYPNASRQRSKINQSGLDTAKTKGQKSHTHFTCTHTNIHIHTQGGKSKNKQKIKNIKYKKTASSAWNMGTRLFVDRSYMWDIYIFGFF